MNKLLSLASLLGLGLSSALAAPFVYPAAWMADDPSQAKMGGELKVVQHFDFKTFNPFLTAEGGNIPVRMSGGVGLFMQNPDDDAFMPWMAAEMPKMSNNGKTFVVKIRQGMKFSDGKPITADDWVMTHKIHLDKEVASTFGMKLYIGDKPITLKKIDQYTLQFDFPLQSAGAYERMSFTPWPAHVFGPVYTKTGAKGIKTMWGLNAKPQQLVSPGPWVFTSYSPGTQATFKKNPYFGAWSQDSKGNKLPYLNSYLVRVIPDENAALASYLAGQIDLYNPSKAEDLGQIKKAIDDGKFKGVLKANISPDMMSHWITFNWNYASNPAKQKLFRDARFRRAMSHLANRAAMVQLAMGGIGSEVYSSVYPMIKNYQFESTPKFKYDPAAAAKLLAELGYTKKNAEGYLVNAEGQVLEFELVTGSNNPTYVKLGQMFTDEAKKAGVKVNFKPVDFNVVVQHFLSQGEDRKFEGALLSMGGAPNYWPFQSNQTLCGGPFHPFNRLKDNACISENEKKITELFNKGDQTLDAAARRKIGEEIVKYEAEDQAMIYLVGTNFHFSYNKKVGGFYKDALINGFYRETPSGYVTLFIK